MTPLRAGEVMYVVGAEHVRSMLIPFPLKRFSLTPPAASVSFGKKQEHNEEWNVREVFDLTRERHT